jgi:hypothetical protein
LVALKIGKEMKRKYKGTKVARF